MKFIYIWWVHVNYVCIDITDNASCVFVSSCSEHSEGFFWFLCNVNEIGHFLRTLRIIIQKRLTDRL